MSRLDENLGAVGFDNLINGLYPPAEVFSVQVAGGQGVLERGTLLASGTDGMVMISASSTGKANAVLADPVDTGAAVEQDPDADDPVTAEAVTATAYRTGHFNTNSLIVADGYEITAADKEALRVAGILISDAVEI